MPLKAVLSPKLWSRALLAAMTASIVFAFPYLAESKSSSAKDDVAAVLQLQADAWNQGDLDKFMSAYLNSEETSYTSGGTEVWGYKALHDRYQNKYGKSPETMGKLSFSDLKCFDLGSKNELAIGRWHLELKTTTLDGVFSLVLVKSKDGWKILHDHTSLSADKKS
ncbi:MAG: nuclear transport factor 2 family protein [Candidatus Obscuribacterales bacterium]|nr:nuclear transport factor 2 family protein [Candidatus Obscuribacterales bacterium]